MSLISINLYVTDVLYVGSTPYSILPPSNFVSIYDVRETLKVKIYVAKNVNIGENYKVSI